MDVFCIIQLAVNIINGNKYESSQIHWYSTMAYNHYKGLLIMSQGNNKQCQKSSNANASRIWKLLVAAFRGETTCPSRILVWIEEMFPLLETKTSDAYRLFYKHIRHIRMMGWSERCVSAMYSAILMYSDIVNAIDDTSLTGPGQVLRRSRRVLQVASFCVRVCNALEHNSTRADYK
jgi:hypothetical protein